MIDMVVLTKKAIKVVFNKLRLFVSDKACVSKGTDLFLHVGHPCVYGAKSILYNINWRPENLVNQQRDNLADILMQHIFFAIMHAFIAGNKMED